MKREWVPYYMNKDMDGFIAYPIHYILFSKYFWYQYLVGGEWLKVDDQWMRIRFLTPVDYRSRIFAIDGLSARSKAFLNVSNPSALGIGDHRNKIRDAVFDDAHAERRLYANIFPVVKIVLRYVNKTPGVKSPEFTGLRVTVDNPAVGVLVTDDGGHLVLDCRI